MQGTRIHVHHMYQGKSLRQFTFSGRESLRFGESIDADIHIPKSGSSDACDFEVYWSESSKKWCCISNGEERLSQSGDFSWGEHRFIVSKLPRRQKAFSYDEEFHEGVENKIEWMQYLVFQYGELQESVLLPPKERFRSELFSFDCSTPPTSKTWEKEQPFENVEIWKRKAFLEKTTFAEKPKLITHRKTLAGFVLIGLTSLFLFLNQKDIDQKEKMPKNAYTRMLYSAEKMEELRAEAKTLLSEELGVSQEVSSSDSAASIRSSASVQRVLTGLKNSQVQKTLTLLAESTKTVLANVSAQTSVETETKENSASRQAKELLAKNIKSSSKSYRTTKKSGARPGLSRKIALAGGGLRRGRTGAASIELFEQETRIEGGLDPEEISKVVRQHLGEVRYCYERQLSAHPDLKGKIQLKFAINSKGLVQQQRVGEDSLKNSSVSGCILRRIARWKFPQPKGGTTVKVTYPFVLSTTN